MPVSAPLQDALRPYLRRFQRDQVRNLYRHEVNSLVGHALGFTLVIAFKGRQLPDVLLLCWAAALIGALVLRVAVLWRFEHVAERRGDAADLRWHTFSICACALAWSGGMLAAFPYLDSGDRAFMMMVLAGITAGALFSLSPSLRSYALFSCALLVPPTTMLFMRPLPGDVATASMATLFLCFCAAGVRKTNVLSARSMLRRYQNEEMMHDLRRARDELQESWARSEAANEAKQQFLANVSHEIRTPLTGILGMSDLMLGTGLNQEQQQCMTTLKRCGSSLLSLIDDLLDFSKIEAGRVEIESVSYDLQQLCGDVAALHGMNARRTGGAEVLLEFAEDVPHRVIGDPTRVRQVLDNLMSNAVKFTDLGEVRLRAERAVENGEERLRLSVQDEGIGIPPDRLEAIFESFTQADGSTTRHYGGTGLGLTISLRLAELMGGTLSVESEVGRGSSFTLDLPLREAECAADGGCPRVLLLGAANEDAERLRATGARVAAPPLDGDLWKRARTWLREGDGGVIVLGAGLGAAERESARALARRGGVALALTEKAASDGVDLPRLPTGGEAGRLARTLSSLAGRAVPPEKPRGLDLLVAEDDPTNARITRHLLEKDGHAVRVAEDGRALLAAYRERPAEIVLMDCQMPRMDGFETTRALRKLPGGRSVPVIALTAHSGPGIVRRCRRAGMDDHLEKPIQRDRLRRVLQRWSSEPAKKRESAPETADEELARPGRREGGEPDGATSPPSPEPPCAS